MSTPADTSTLLVSCPDRRGIVAALAQVLHGHGANILDSDQHTDPEAGIFFQRIRFDTTDLVTDRLSLERAVGEVAARMDMLYRLCTADRPKRMAIFVSKTDHCLYDLILRQRSGELRCEIPLIVSNHPDLKPVAEQFGIEFHVFPITADNKHEQEERELELLARHSVDFVAMARYMQILSSEFIAAHPSWIINIHHSFLPAFSGGRPYRQAHERGVKLIGATAHYATADLDEGPIIEQAVERVDHTFTPSELTNVGRDLESIVLNRAIRWHAEHRVFENGNKTVVLK